MDNTILSPVKTALKAFTIPSPYRKRGIEYVEQLIQTGDDTEAKLGIMIGTSGVGKTHLCNKIQKLHPDVITVEKTFKPVIYVKLGATASMGDVLSAIQIKLLGAKSKGKMTNQQRLDHICKLMREVGTKLVIIDEAQHAMAGVSNEYGRTGEYINTLKTLIDDGGVPILVAGLAHLTKLRSFPGKNEDFGKQLKRRSLAPVELKPFDSKGTAMAIKFYQKHLQKSNVECDVLSHVLVKARIHLCSGGAIGVIFDLLKSSLQCENGRVQISLNSLENTAKILFDEEDNAFQFTEAEVKRLITNSTEEAA